MSGVKPVIFRLKKDDVWNGIFLYEEDLFVLEQVYIHKMIRSPLVHEYYNYLSNNTRSRGAISQRLKKLVDAGVLSLESDIKPYSNYEFYFYKVGKRGLVILKQWGVIPDNKNIKNLISAYGSLKIPTAHNIGLSHLAHNAFLTCLKNRFISPFKHMPGSSHSLFVNEQVAVVPDWLFVNGTTLICIEFDTGNQRPEVIRHKYKMYLNKSREFTDFEKVIVVFAVADDSVEGEYSDNRDRRVASLKSLCPEISEWNVNQTDTELSFFAATAARTPQIIERLLSNESALPSRLRAESVLDWFINMSHVMNDTQKYAIESIDKSLVLEGNRANKSLDCDMFFQWSRKTTSRHLLDKQKQHLVGVVLADEGSIFSLQAVEANLRRMKTIAEREVYATATVIVCYADGSQAVHDVHGIADYTFRITSADEWQSALQKRTGAPQVYETVSAYSKKRKEFDLL